MTLSRLTMLVKAEDYSQDETLIKIWRRNCGQHEELRYHIAACHKEHKLHSAKYPARTVGALRNR